ncbi:MAG: glycogen debranching protein GlgX [Acidobacteriota bacterium]
MSDWQNESPATVLPGRPLPLGSSITTQGMNFAIFSSSATDVSLVLYQSGLHHPLLEVPLDRFVNRTGFVWHIELAGITPDVRYGWRMDRQPPSGDPLFRFEPSLVLVDPYAKALTGASEWGQTYVRDGQPSITGDGARRCLHVRDDFDWDGTRRPLIPLADKIIYEMHVRGFTRHPSSAVKHPGTYLGLIDRIPYLQDLGVTTVELLPVYEFEENESRRINPFNGEMLLNFWGYSPICFFAPKAAYAANGRNGEQVREFKTLVRELHRAGLEVFLDVVFNHTAEGRGLPDDPTFSFRGIDNPVYYMLDDDGRYLDYSGCGNTLNCNHPVVRELVLDTLRYWVSEMQIDGFRFDLASILGRGEDGEILANPPLLEFLASDPVLADTTLIAEAWDASGLYQVGTFPAFGRWAEWNGAFRDDVRRFVRGERGFAGPLATRLAGSSDLYQTSMRTPAHSVNFVTCHDGFTLADLVAYEQKHNEANGDNNTDGASENFSWNSGVEGPSDDPWIVNLRQRQVRNFLMIMMVSQGPPMILGGDEIGRTQQGNNNAYCQDNELSWMDWALAQKNAGLLRFTRELIAFRRLHPSLRRRAFFEGGQAGQRADVMWHGTEPWAPDWEGQTLAMHLAGEFSSPPDEDIYFAINAGSTPVDFDIPPPPGGKHWLVVADSAGEAPEDIFGRGEERLLQAERMTVEAHSSILLRCDK